MRYSSGMSKPVFLKRPKLCPLIQIWNLLLNPGRILQAESYFSVKWLLEKHNCNAYHQLSRDPLEVCGWTCLCWSDIGCLMKEAHILVNRDIRHLNSHELLSTTCVIVHCTWGHAQAQTAAGTQKACIYAREVLQERAASCWVPAQIKSVTLDCAREGLGEQLAWAGKCLNTLQIHGSFPVQSPLCFAR